MMSDLIRSKEIQMVAASFQLHSLLVARLGLLAEFQQKLAANQSQAELLGKELLEAAPASVREFLENEGILDNLMRYGQSSTKIVFGTYGFLDGGDVVDKIRRLGDIWMENVAIKIYPAERHRIEISFTTLTPFAS